MSEIALRLPIGRIDITSAVFVPVSGRTFADNGDVILELPMHCRVQGKIAPVEPDSLPTYFNVNMSVDWNGKTLQSGGGGLGGGMNTAPGRKGFGPSNTIPIHDIDPKTLELRRSMVACVYPIYTRYNGIGDINDSTSYSCADRQDPLGYRAR